MRKANLRRNHDTFDDAVTRYRSFLNKIICAQRVISTPQEKRDLSESTLLRICAHWERFVDGHLVDCVNRDHTKLSAFFEARIPDNPSKDLCQALIIGEGYTDFKSINDLRRFSRRILPNESNPFLAISRRHADKLDEVYVIRNYLSHYSTKSRRSLMRVYRSSYQMERFYEPGQFLLAYDAERLWAYFAAFEGASADMKAWCDA